MKLNFRKIASVLSSAVMVSSTVALAAAASYPAPFVSNGTADVAVVWGSTATLDTAAVNDIVASLNSKVTPGEGSSTTVTGESFTLAKTNNKFNLNEDLNDIYASLDVDELPSLLADDEYEVDDTEYEQTINLYPLALGFQQDNDFNDKKPFIGFDLTSGTNILNYTLEFDSAVQFEGDTEISIMGKKFYIAENASDETSTGQMSITLLDASATQTIKEGESLTIEAANGKTYTVTLEVVEEGDTNAEDEATFTVDGETFDSIEAGDSEEVEEGVYLVASDVNYYDSDRTISNAKISLGTGKMFLENGQEVELNDEALSDTYEDHLLTAYFANSTASEVTSLTLQWAADDDLWLTKGTDLVMPGFESVKLTMGDLIQSDFETTTLDTENEAYFLTTTIAEGDVSIPLIYQASDSTDIAGLGSDSDEALVVSVLNGTQSTKYSFNATAPAVHFNLNSANDPTFVLSWTDGADEGETYAYKLKESGVRVDSEASEVTLTALAEGGKDIVFEDLADTGDAGDNIVLTLDSATEGGYVNITATVSSGTAYTDRVFTEAGLTMLLPTAAVAGWNATFFEEDEDGNLQVASPNFSISTTSSLEDGIYPGAIQGPNDYETEDDSDIQVAYVESDVATKILLTDPSEGAKTVEILYPGEESYVEVMVAESGASIDDGETGNIVPIYDTGSIPTDKNLIVVGGSCVNTLAAQLLGLPAGSCGNSWQSKTGVGAGQFLIQTFSRDNSKVATLVAGYNMEDTANAVKALKTDSTVDVSAGKKFVGTATSVQAVAVA